MRLTDVAIRKAKSGDKVIRLFDGGGLYLEVSPSGGKWWRYKYRIGGKEKRLSLGTYPDTGLAEARSRHAEARKLLAANVDPSAHRQAEKAAGSERAANSFELVTREWLGKQPWVPTYSAKVEAWMVNDVFPIIGARPVAELSAPEFLRVARRVEERGAIESAHRIMQNCGQVMRYAIATGRAERNPVADLRGALPPPAERHHAAITDPQESRGTAARAGWLHRRCSHMCRAAASPSGVRAAWGTAPCGMVGNRPKCRRVEHPRIEDEDARCPHRPPIHTGCRGPARPSTANRTPAVCVSRRT